jgi:hypothetical protein
MRWETVTAIFGWTACVSIVAWMILSAVAYLVAGHNWPLNGYLFQLGGFSLLTAVSRDWEKVLRPLLPWNR